jgi:carboxylesterase
MPVRPGAEPYRHDGGQVGVLLCHGFTGSPASLRPWAQALADEGYSVDLPLLPGHGTSWQDLDRTSWPDWFAAVERGLLALADRCSTVVVGGLSMGGTLALRLAQQYDAIVKGLVLVNPVVTVDDRRLLALPVLRRVFRSLAGISNDIAKPGQDEVAYDRTPLNALHSQIRLWRLARQDLSLVTQPILLHHSVTDHVIGASSTPLILSGVSSTDVTTNVLERSYHVATLDHDAPEIEKSSVEFIRRITGAL